MEDNEKEFKSKYIDPFTDFGFKKLFGEECNKDLLLDFLNELLRKKAGEIVSLSYLKNDKLGVSAASRKAVFDIHCENDKGEKFIVELQKTKQEYFKDRLVYYSTFPITEQAKQGDWNFELKAIYCIAILDFVFKEDKPEKYYSGVLLLDEDTHEIFYDKLKFICLEMPKFNKGVDELETHFEKWLYVIRNLKRLDNIPDRLRERVFERMFAAAEIAKLTPAEYKDYIDSLNSYRDLKNSLDYSKAEGIEIGVEIGVEKGIKKGKAEGKAEEKLEIAKKLLNLGIQIETIILSTGLTKEEIEKIIIMEKINIMFKDRHVVEYTKEDIGDF